MIRLVQRKLIIPRGDTGSFALPTIMPPANTDVAVFIIFNEMTRSKIFEKICQIDSNKIVVNFTYNDTITLIPGSYVWDIRFYKNPQYLDNEIISVEEVHSYYAGYRLPQCEVRETGEAMQVSLGPNVNQTTQESDTLVSIIRTLNTITNSVKELQQYSSHYPKIQDGYWFIWDETLPGYVNSGIQVKNDDEIQSLSNEDIENIINGVNDNA